MNRFLISAGTAALMMGVGTNASAETFAPSSLHIDALGMTPSDLHIDALGYDARDLHIDALDLHIDALGGLFSQNSLHIDALGYRPSELHIDALGGVFNPNDLHIDALDLHIDALSLHIDALSGNETMLSGQVDYFWGSFSPSDLHIDALDLHIDALDLHIDALDLHIDALAQFDTDSLHIDALDLHIDALGALFNPNDLHIDALDLHIDALEAFNPASLHIDALSLHIDALDLHIDALSQIEALDLHIDALELHIDALAALKELSLHIDALDLHIDALNWSEMELHIDALAQLQELSLHIDALELHIDALDMEELSLHIDALQMEQLSLHIDALRNIGELSLHIDALAEAASAISEAYTSYSGLLGSAEAAFAGLVEAQTGANFSEGFLDGFLAKHGLAGDGFVDFLGLSQSDRNAFIIDLSDQLTTFLGIDHPDHWMSAVYWSPRLSEVAGYGEGVTVGVVDQAFDGAGALAEAPQTFGEAYAGQTHGLGVTGVLAGALDGQGVMGVAPGADIVLSNPFGANGEADELDVGLSLVEVGLAGASIINLSLGEAGQTFSDGWVEVFDRQDVIQATEDSLFIMAAGNDGVTQELDVDFGDNDVVNRIILVGALGLDGELASFSNAPGDACFVVGGECTPMMNRFLVAPGQQILVETGEGVGRASGTSFAAPMVAGAAALLESRWPWLERSPETTAEILFRSATDLGEEGVDEVYGWGLLNIEASQRPLDMADLRIRGRRGSQSLFGAGLTPNLMARINRRDTITAFERVGDTFRDFKIPVGALRAGIIDPSVGMEQSVERYFGERLGVASGATQSVSGLSLAGANGFTDASALSGIGFGGEQAGWTLTFEARQPAHGLAVPEGGLAFETHGVLKATESGMSLAFGGGDGALAFASDTAFTMTSDHDIETGGVNPFLGLASGGSYFAASVPVSDRLALTGGVTFNTDADLVVNPFSGALTERVEGTEGYQAAAFVAGASYQLREQMVVRFDVTSLTETDGLLGGQSVGGLSFGETAESRSITAGMDSALPFGAQLSLSASVGRTTGGAQQQGNLGIDGDGLVTSAFQAAVSKTGLLAENDRLRLSFAQPLHVEEGNLAVDSLSVIDRSTGELGFAPDQLSLTGADRRFVSEVLYGRSVLDGRADLSLFGQYDTSPLLTPGEGAASAGLRFTIGF